MRAHWQAFLCALQFLTLVPVQLAGMPDAKTQARAALYYPLVGVLLGLVLVLVAMLFTGLPTGVTAAVLVALWAGVTGGLHLDGLADSGDGWMGGLGDRERTLAIMKDPHIGASGALVLMLQLLLKWSLLSALLASGSLWPLLLAPVVGRAGALALLATTPYARADGIATPWLSALSLPKALGCVALVVLLLSLLNPLSALLVIALAWALRRLMLRRLGGTTGDTLGALIELLETLLLFSALIKLG